MNTALYYLYLAFFLSHIPITCLVDGQAGERTGRAEGRVLSLPSCLLSTSLRAPCLPTRSVAGGVVPSGSEGCAGLVL